MIIASVGTAHPPHHHSQDALIDAFEAVWAASHHNTHRVRRFHDAVCVGGRHTALPLSDYPSLTFKEANDTFLTVGLDVAEQALRSALDEAGLAPGDLDAIFVASVTGIGTPSLDARLFNRMGLRPDIKRVPIFGLGCVAGAAGLARVHDYLRGFPQHTAALVCVELCSLTLQREDLSVANLVASGLFGDGAAAVIGLGAEHPAAHSHSGPRVLSTRSRMYPNTEHVMGWDIGPSGFKVVLDASVPDVARTFLGDDVRGFLADHQLRIGDVPTWVCHPGGPKVLDAFRDALSLSEAQLELTWRSLRREGNMSSASVLFVLRDTLTERPLEPGAPGVLMAMGPGFCSELVLLQGAPQGPHKAS